MSDVLIVGAGPAGMAAALELVSHGLSVTVTDDQPAPGGRIFAAIENRPIHGREDHAGANLVAQFRAAGGSYLPNTEVWQIEPGPRVFLTTDGKASMVEPRFVLLATGAQERPMPFPGWQLPGVMTVGAGQILLKTARQIPIDPVWLAGTGPLLLLYARQLIDAGGSIAGILDTTPPRSLGAAAALVPGALRYGWRDLIRGLAWSAGIRRTSIIHGVVSLEATGQDRLSEVRYATRDGKSGTISTSLLLVHDGVVPGIHATLSAGCQHRWNVEQKCFEPTLVAFGASSDSTIYVAGDGAGIRGAGAAILSGKLAAIGIAASAGMLSTDQANRLAAPLRRRLSSSSAFRRLVDTLYPPADLAIPDTTIICRCEEVTAGQIREVLLGRPQLGPDGIKASTRAGMGPCQGRQCGLSLTRLVSEMHGENPNAIGFLRIRPPLKPLTLSELVGLETA